MTGFSFSRWAFLLSRCGDAWSIDRVIRSYRAGPPVQPVAPSGEYNWPIKCVWLISALVFFAAGVAKLRFSGLAWITSDNMANMLLQHHYKSDPIVGWGKIIANYPLLCQTLAAGTIVLELGFVLAIFSRIARWLFVPGMFVMQVGIALLMGVVFTQFMFVYLFWIPWDALGRFILRHVRPDVRSTIRLLRRRLWDLPQDRHDPASPGRIASLRSIRHRQRLAGD